MGLFNKIFRSTTDGLVEANLESYFIARSTLARSVAVSRGTSRLPIQFHAINIALQARHPNANKQEAVIQNFFINLSVCAAANESRASLPEGFVVDSFLFAMFAFECHNANAKTQSTFQRAVRAGTPKFAQRYRVDLSSQVDLSFLSELGIELEQYSKALA